MPTLWLKRVGHTLHADGDSSIALLSKLPFNKALKAEIKAPRNAKFHRLFWEMCQRIGNAVGSDAETISDTLKIETGHCTLVKSKKYGVLRLPKSISFAAMDGAAFNAFFDKCLEVIYSEWAIQRSDILAELGDLIEQPKADTPALQSGAAA